MSTYGHELERQISAQSVQSRGNSEWGSRYSTEGGIYMSSFAATVFISGLVTVGVSLLSLLVALTVMLRSCQSRNSGFVEVTFTDTNNYHYCRTFAQHAELNGLGAHAFPAMCNHVNALYVNEGQYRRDLNTTVAIAEDYFSSVIIPGNDGRDVVLLDADDLLPSRAISSLNLKRMWDDKDAFHDTSIDADYWKYIFATKLYLKLQSDRWSLVLLSRKPEKLRDSTIEYLTTIGCHGWSSLIMRVENETEMNFQEFLSRERSRLQNEGFRIVASISSQMDALRGPCLGNRIFKLPNPMVKYSFEDHFQDKIRLLKKDM